MGIIILFQYPKVRLKVIRHIRQAAKRYISIPEGAIKSFANDEVPSFHLRFQYPKVRLKGGCGCMGWGV